MYNATYGNIGSINIGAVLGDLFGTNGCATLLGQGKFSLYPRSGADHQSSTCSSCKRIKRAITSSSLSLLFGTLLEYLVVIHLPTCE